MLDFKDTDLARREITAARALTEKQLANFKNQKKLYTGAFWQSGEGLPSVDEGSDVESTDGTRFEFVALMMARMSFRVPSVTITSRRTGPQEQIAIAMKHACNRIIADSNYRQCQVESANDFLHQDAVLHLSLSETSLYGGDKQELNPLWPEANRISPTMFFQDPAALGPTLVRFRGHDTYIDKDDFIQTCELENEEEDDERRQWDMEAVRSIPENEGWDANGELDVPDRKQIVLTTVWVMGYEDENHPGAEEGYYGTVFYYGSSTDEEDNGMLLLKEEPFYGPPWGPYYVGSAYLVPDSPYGLSPVTAAEGQLREGARHAKAVGDTAEAYKKITLVDDPDNTLGQRIANSPHLHVHNVTGLDRSRVVDTVIGGADQQSVAYLQLTRERVDRMLGISDAMRGTAAGDATATESALAGQAGDMRIAWIQAQFMELHERLFRGFTWYLWKTEEVRVALGPEAAEELGLPGQEIEFVGGETPETADMDWADLELTINLRSTEHESSQQKLARVQAGAQVLMSAAQAAPMAPWINWEEFVKIQGEALGENKLHELWDQQMFEAFVARQMQMEMAHKQEPAGDRLLSSHPGPRSAPPEPNVQALQPPTPDMGGSGGMPGQSSGATAGAQAQQGAF